MIFVIYFPYLLVARRRGREERRLWCRARNWLWVYRIGVASVWVWRQTERMEGGEGGWRRI
jgi:hypothetical protein